MAEVLIPQRVVIVFVESLVEEVDAVHANSVKFQPTVEQSISKIYLLYSSRFVCLGLQDMKGIDEVEFIAIVDKPDLKSF